VQELGGKVAVITGGGSGIGLATAEALAAQGMDVLLADIEANALRGAAERVAAHGGRVSTATCDVADRAAVESLADQAWDELGGCHVLFNNAGVAVSGPIQEMTHDDWRWVLDVDLWGVIHGVEAFVPRMIGQGEGGHVVSTASFAGLVPNEGLGVYCVAKYGVVALMECLRRDLRPHDIGSSVLCPMRVATNIDASARNRADDYGGPADAPAVDEDEMAGRLIEVGPVADLVVQGILQNELYLLPHPESERFIRNRFDRILSAFERLPGVPVD
jgi:NAD(P)-dependent dehydrogenase (short-subunit alcohol dehydrogenase family)